MNTPPKIVELTVSQRRAILASDDDGKLPAYRDMGRLVDSIAALGLASHGPGGVRLNRRGFKLRKELLKSADRDAA